MARKPMTKARAKRLIGVGTAVAPLLAPYALAAAGAVRGSWDSYRAGRLGVSTDRLAEFTGPGGGLHARVSHLAEALHRARGPLARREGVRRAGPAAAGRAGHRRARRRTDAQLATAHRVQSDQRRARRHRARGPHSSGYPDLSYRLAPWWAASATRCGPGRTERAAHHDRARRGGRRPTGRVGARSSSGRCSRARSWRWPSAPAAPLATVVVLGAGQLVLHMTLAALHPMPAADGTSMLGVHVLITLVTAVALRYADTAAAAVAAALRRVRSRRTPPPAADRPLATRPVPAPRPARASRADAHRRRRPARPSGVGLTAPTPVSPHTGEHPCPEPCCGQAPCSAPQPYSHWRSPVPRSPTSPPTPPRWRRAATASSPSVCPTKTTRRAPSP